MLCGKCGALNPNSRAFCKSCGHSLWPTREAKSSVISPAVREPEASVPEQSRDNVQPPLASLRADSSDETEFYGVRGWLMLYCINLTLLNPLYILVELVPRKDFLTFAINVGLATLFIYTGTGLWRQRANCLEWLETCFVIQLIAACILIASSTLSKHGLWEPDLSLNPQLEAGIRSLASTIIWWGYFKKSKRVRATYGRNL